MGLGLGQKVGQSQSSAAGLWKSEVAAFTLTQTIMQLCLSYQVILITFLHSEIYFSNIILKAYSGFHGTKVCFLLFNFIVCLSGSFALESSAPSCMG